MIGRWLKTQYSDRIVVADLVNCIFGVFCDIKITTHQCHTIQITKYLTQKVMGGDRALVEATRILVVWWEGALLALCMIPNFQDTDVTKYQ